MTHPMIRERRAIRERDALTDAICEALADLHTRDLTRAVQTLRDGLRLARAHRLGIPEAVMQPVVPLPMMTPAARAEWCEGKKMMGAT